MPEDPLSPSLDSLSVFLIDLTRTRCMHVRGLVLALFCEGLMSSDEDAESAPLGDTVVR